MFAFCGVLLAASIASADPVLTVNGSAAPVTVSPGATLSVSVTGGPGHATDWVGLFVPTAADTSFLSWMYLNESTTPPATGATTATVTVTAPGTAGSYEFRFFANNVYTRLATSARVTVSATPVVTVNGSAAPLFVLPGQRVTVSIAASPGNPTDWLGLHVPTAANTSSVSWTYLNGTTTPSATGLTSATLTITAPATVGPYEFRLFANNGYTRLATSATMTVAASGDIVYDTFTGSSETVLTTHAPDTNVLGRPWTALSGSTPVLSNGRLRANAASVMVIDGGTPNASVSVKWYPGTAEGLEAGLVFRAVDAQNFFLFRMRQNRLALYHVVNGQWTELWLNVLEDGEPRETAHTLSVQLSGATITVFWDGGVQMYTITDYAHIQGQLYGVWWSGADAASAYDFFNVSGALPPPAARVTVSGANSLVFNGQTTLAARAYDAANVEIPNTSFLWASSTPQIVSLSPVSANVVLVTGAGIGETAITATPSRGGTGTAPMTVTPGSTIVYDTFTGATGTLLADHTPDVNQMGSPWVVGGGLHPALSANRLAASGTAAWDSALIDAGTPNVAAAVNWTPGTAADLDAWLIFRASDARNYFAFQMSLNRVRLLRVVNGVSMELASQWLDDAPRTGRHTLQVVLSGPTIEASWDGGVRVIALMDTFNINATKYGLGWSSLDTASTYDYFRITGTLAPPATRVVVNPSAGEVPFHGAVTLSATAYDAADQPISDMNFSWSTSNPPATTVAGSTLSTAWVSGTGEGVSTITATPSRGPAGRAILTTNPGTTLVFDSFTGANGTALTTHTPDVTQMDGPWTVVGSPGVVLESNGARAQGAATKRTALIEGGDPDAIVSAKWRHGDGINTESIAAGVIARASDAENYFMAYVSDPFLTLARVRWGSWTALGGVRMADDYFRAGTHRLEIRLRGSTIEVWLGETRHIQVSDSFNMGASQYGLWWSEYDSRSVFDEFSVVGNMPPEVSSLNVSPAALNVAPYEAVLLAATARNDNGALLPDAVIAWSSSNTSIARVNPVSRSTGATLPVATGTATITAHVPRGRAPNVEIPVVVSVCVDSISPPSTTVDADGEAAAVSVSASAGCTWRATSLADWLTVTAGSSGGGAGSVTIIAAPNNTVTTRTGQVGIGGQLFSVTQAPVLSGCVQSISPTQETWSSEGGYGYFKVTAPLNCRWLPISSDGWLEPLEGYGEGTWYPRFSVSPNTGLESRTATLTIGTHTFTVVQAAGTGGTGNCTVTQAPYVTLFDAGIWETDIVGPATCTWGASSDVSWITVAVSSGNGPGAFAFILAPNDTASPRIGHINVAGQTLMIQQAAGMAFQPPPAGLVWACTTETILACEDGCSFYDYDICTSEQGPPPTPRITGSRRLTLFLDVLHANGNGNFDPNSPSSSDHDEYVPGADPGSGASVALPQRLQVIAAYVDQYGRIAAPPTSGGAQVTFSLEETSAFVGHAMNAGSSTDPDFALVNTTAGWQADRTARVELRAYDYGGFTRVKAIHGTANARFRLPLDPNGNGLPDRGWLAHESGSSVPVGDSGASVADDNENEPLGDGTPGDGFSRFEEYRGFIVSGVHRRTSPNKKDLFASSSVRTETIDWGLEFASPNLPLTVHRIYGQDDLRTAEYRVADRVVNFNFENAGAGGEIPHIDQRALRILIGPVRVDGQEVGGWTDTPLCFPVTPNEVAKIEINVARHYQEGYRRSNNEDQILNEVKRTIGHEVGHAINISHRPYPCPGRDPGPVPSIMSSEWFNGPDRSDPRSQYNLTDKGQIRLRHP